MTSKDTSPDAIRTAADRIRNGVAGVLLRVAHRVASHHIYLSTGCLHGDHDYCNGRTGAAGRKTPARCKFCDAPCQCRTCHRGGGE